MVLVGAPHAERRRRGLESGTCIESSIAHAVLVDVSHGVGDECDVYVLKCA